MIKKARSLFSPGLGLLKLDIDSILDSSNLVQLTYKQKRWNLSARDFWKKWNHVNLSTQIFSTSHFETINNEITDSQLCFAETLTAWNHHSLSTTTSFEASKQTSFDGFPKKV